jgi:putative DNA primase/helicase
MLYEVIGLCMCRDSGRYAAGYVMENGTASNGKSTYLRLLRNVLGNDTISRLNPQQLGGRFSGGDLEGKLAVIADDVPADVVDGASSQVFKCLCSGDPISAEVKCGPRYSFTPKATVVFSCNTMPRFKGVDNGILRRVVPLPLNARFSGSNDDPKVKADLVKDEQVIEYAISRGVQALHGIIERGHVTKCKEHDNLVKAIETESNSALAYLEVAELEGRQIEGRPTSEVYGSYKLFCANSGLTRPFSLSGFTRELKRFGWGTKVAKFNDAALGKSVPKRCYVRL